jgi:Fic/DOC family
VGGKLQQTWPEAFVSTSETTVAVSRAAKAGQLRKLASRLYTRNLTDTPTDIIRRNLWQIAGGYFPGGLIADRTALENMPATDGSVCLITERGTDIKLPGLVLRPRRGIAPTADDRPFVGGLFLSSTARAYLENIRASRTRGGLVSRTLSRKELEEKLDSVLRHNGEVGLNRLRDDIRILAPVLGLKAEATALDELIGTLLGTRAAEMVSPSGRARRAGRPYDPDRAELFHTLHRELRNHIPTPLLAKKRDATGLANLAFFEAYFSNFIEGTEFDVDEAAAIVFRGVIPTDRPEDAHDVLGTWRIVSDTGELSRVPTTQAEFLRLLRSRHAAIMEGRPDKAPGAFKTGLNRAGATVFVAPDLVEGTLDQGFTLLRSLGSPFQRAAFMMFLVAEVHPFVDGNGRTARVMMNAELVAANEERIIIPTVFRNNYLAALKALSQNGIAEPLILTLDYAQRWTNAIPWNTLDGARRALESCHAFVDPNEADHQGIRLVMPKEIAEWQS